jgi:hypothetical protein
LPLRLQSTSRVGGGSAFYVRHRGRAFFMRLIKVATAFFLAGIFYFVDCMIAYKSHPEVSWFESGIYCPGPFGFLATVCFAAVGIWFCVKRDD